LQFVIYVKKWIWRVYKRLGGVEQTEPVTFCSTASVSELPVIGGGILSAKACLRQLSL
jgi:hypothetical protein